MSNKLIFNSDWLPERERFPAFQALMSQVYVPFDIVERPDVGPFRSALSLQRAGKVSIGRLAITPTEYTRPARLVRQSDDDLGLVLCLQGAAYLDQGNRPALQAGEAITCDSARPGTICVTTDSQFWVLKFPRQAVSGLLPNRTRFAGARLDHDPGARKLLAGYLQAGRELDIAASPQAARCYEEHIIDLIALALGSEGDARHEAEQRGARAARRDAILRAIQKYAGNPNLTTASIALLLQVTPRYVRMLLEETGKSFSEHLMEHRLQRALALLRDAAHPERKIADIAFDCGFGDLSYFNRSFRRRYGATPSDIRATIRNGA
jgi:AraC-like DNA-binding protein